MIENSILDYFLLYTFPVLEDIDFYYEIIDDWLIALDRTDLFFPQDINIFDYGTYINSIFDDFFINNLINENDAIIFDYILNYINYDSIVNILDYNNVLWLTHHYTTFGPDNSNSFFLNLFYLLIGWYDLIVLSEYCPHACHKFLTSGVAVMLAFRPTRIESVYWFDDIFLNNAQVNFYFIFMDIKYYIFLNLKIFDTIINDLILLINIVLYLFIFILEILSSIFYFIDIQIISNNCVKFCYYLQEFNEFFINYKYNIYVYQYKNIDIGFYIYLFFVGILNFFFIISLSKVFYKCTLYF